MSRGGKRDGAGRDKGVPNKATTQAREAIAAFVEGNVERLNGWLDAIATDNPKNAFDCFMNVVEYHIPKLARTEHQPLDKNGQPTDNTLTIVTKSDSEIIERFLQQNGAKNDGDSIKA